MTLDDTVDLPICPKARIRGFVQAVVDQRQSKGDQSHGEAQGRMLHQAPRTSAPPACAQYRFVPQLTSLRFAGTGALGCCEGGQEQERHAASNATRGDLFGIFLPPVQYCGNQHKNQRVVRPMMASLL